jgi:hypothetical protein
MRLRIPVHRVASCPVRHPVHVAKASAVREKGSVWQCLSYPCVGASRRMPVWSRITPASTPPVGDLSPQLNDLFGSTADSVYGGAPLGVGGGESVTTEQAE